MAIRNKGQEMTLQASKPVEPTKIVKLERRDTLVAWLLYAALLEQCWKPGDDERAKLENRKLDRIEAEERERIERTGTERPPEPGDLDFTEEEWTDEETLLARLGLLDDANDEDWL